MHNETIQVVRRDRHLHTSYVKCVGGVPLSLNQGTEEALLNSLNRLGLHEVFESSHLNKGAGHRIKPAPPLEDLHRVTSRQEGMNSLHKRKRQESIRRKHKKAE